MAKHNPPAFDVIVRIYATQEDLLRDDVWKIPASTPGVAANKAFNLSVDELRGRGKKLPKNFDRALMVVRPK